ncbi:alpha/beta hydrolase [Thioclava sp. GXIMD4215]|uniref:alpha/beta hydrolase n=1 Tax=Thioclava sp. GXIMD4215 TaxID=3131928 RepID=UPI00324FE7B1
MSSFDCSTHVYTTSSHKKGEVDLHVDLYRPKESSGPVPLVVWLHAGGFRTGSRQSWTHAKIAQIFVDEGYAFAALDYRLARPPAVLSWPTQQKLSELLNDGQTHCPGLNESFRGRRPMAVVEDVCAFFGWITAREAEFGLSGEYLLAGASAGGISVLNTLFLAEHLGRTLPPIRAAFVLSGGFAFPSFMGATRTPILAIHNPADERVDFSAIMLLKEKRPEQVELIVAHRQKHGFPMVIPEEPMAAGIGRFITFDRRMQNGLPLRRMPLILDAPGTYAADSLIAVS